MGNVPSMQRSRVAAAYQSDVFAMMAAKAVSSAEVIIPLVHEHLAPRSVIDYGGGTGAWAAAFRRHGVDDVLVVDGAWTDRSQLQVAPKEFRCADVCEPFDAGRSFDLAVCLEVAGHIPPDRELVFVEALASMAPAVLFSAPTLYQPGIGAAPLNNRVPRHWAELFAAHDMVWTDFLRLRVWEDPRVVWWYAQNIALVVHETVLAQHPALERHRTASPPTILHPNMVRYLAEPPPPGLRQLLQGIPGAIRRRIGLGEGLLNVAVVASAF